MLFELNAASSGTKTAKVTTKALGVWMVAMAGTIVWGM